MKALQLITLDELREIRRIWVIEKHELEDSLPLIYQEVIGQQFPDDRLDEAGYFKEEDMAMLRDICKGDELIYQLVRELIDIEKSYKSMERRSGLFDAFEQAFRRNFYSDEADATTRARRLSWAMEEAKKGKYQQLPLFADPSTSSHEKDNQDNHQQ
jgi:DNA sulfur modification protein DndC